MFEHNPSETSNRTNKSVLWRFNLSVINVNKNSSFGGSFLFLPVCFGVVTNSCFSWFSGGKRTFLGTSGAMTSCNLSTNSTLSRLVKRLHVFSVKFCFCIGWFSFSSSSHIFFSYPKSFWNGAGRIFGGFVVVGMINVGLEKSKLYTSELLSSQLSSNWVKSISSTVASTSVVDWECDLIVLYGGFGVSFFWSFPVFCFFHFCYIIILHFGSWLRFSFEVVIRIMLFLLHRNLIIQLEIDFLH